MRYLKPYLLLLAYLVVVIFSTSILYKISLSHTKPLLEHNLILNASDYDDEELETTYQQLLHRIKVQPFNLISLGIFALAIVHTFLTPWLQRITQKIQHKSQKERPSFLVEILHFFGEVEVVFGLWVIPLMIAMTFYFDWRTSLHYLNGIDYTEAMFVVVIMSLASTKPILSLTEECLKFIAKLGGETPTAWWWTILSFGPLLGSLITEPAAMTLSALLLGKHFYKYNPPKILAYATVGLLFTNISVGGVLTNFAAPPVLMVSKAWSWSSTYMFFNFGIKAICGIFLSNLVYFLIFYKPLKSLSKNEFNSPTRSSNTFETIPMWICVTHILFLAWIVIHNHYPVIFLGSFLLFLGFYKATASFQNSLELKTPILVGYFLAGLVVHGSLQGWWITPLLEHATEKTLMVLALFLTAFNDNAAITFLATLIPNFSETMRFAVVAGAVTGGGLTVIANAPNLPGQSLLSPFFKGGLSPLYLLLAASIPTFIIGAIFFITLIT